MLGDLTTSCLSLHSLIQYVCLLEFVCIHFYVCVCVCVYVLIHTSVCTCSCSYALVHIGACTHSCGCNSFTFLCTYPFAGVYMHISGDQGTPLGVLLWVMATLCFESGSLRGSLITLGCSEPGNPLIQYPALGLQAHTTMFSFLMWVQRMGSGSHLV